MVVKKSQRDLICLNYEWMNLTNSKDTTGGIAFFKYGNS